MNLWWTILNDHSIESCWNIFINSVKLVSVRGFLVLSRCVISVLLLGMWWLFLVLFLWFLEAWFCSVVEASLKPTMWLLLAAFSYSLSALNQECWGFSCSPCLVRTALSLPGLSWKLPVRPMWFPLISYLNVKCTKVLVSFLNCAQDSLIIVVSYFAANFILILGSCADFFIFTSPAVSCMPVWI